MDPLTKTSSESMDFSMLPFSAYDADTSSTLEAKGSVRSNSKQHCSMRLAAASSGRGGAHGGGIVSPGSSHESDSDGGDWGMGDAGPMDAGEEELAGDAEGLDEYPAVVQLMSTDTGEVPVVRLLHANVNLPADETAHLASAGFRSADVAGDDHHACLKILFHLLADGTMANEVDMCHTLLQWPYLTDMTLISALVSIFQPSWCRPPASPVPSWLPEAAGPWFYFNLLIRNSQLFLPVLSTHLKHAPHVAPPTCDGRSAALQHAPSVVHGKLLGQHGGGAGAAAPPRQADKLDWERLGTVLSQLYQQAQQAGLPDLGGGGGGGGRQRDGPSPYLEDTGVALSMGALRFGYFFGGDGESMMQVGWSVVAGWTGRAWCR